MILLKSIWSKYLRGNSYLLMVLLVLLVTNIAMFILSNLITKEVRKVNLDLAERINKNRSIELKTTLNTLRKPLNLALNFSSKSSGDTLQSNLKSLQKALLFDSLYEQSWLILNDKPIVLVSQNEQVSPTATLASLKKNNVMANGENPVWRNVIQIQDGKDLYHFGFDINLKKTHSLFEKLGTWSQSYAYIFDDQGICIMHPDEWKIGQNIFQFGEISSADTKYIEGKKEARTVQSEFLKMDVLSFISDFKIEDQTFFISVNFPKSIIEEDIVIINIYAYVIYSLCSALLLFVFYIFILRIKKSYQERSFMENAKAELIVEREKFQKQSAFLQLQQFKNQINPHFLFNSLNTLYTLVDKEAELAKQFTHKLSRLYRYLTDSPTDNLTLVTYELEIVHEYLFMQKIRFGERLTFETIKSDENALQKKIPFLSLQTVVENALKHNVATTQQPLHIEIEIQSDIIIISNPYAPKNTLEVSADEKFGLKYLRSIYQYHHSDEFSTYIENGKFICELPLL